ncbi:MAG TPA: SgcJ/EcaC family oxidoreductase [Polyangia bacterium]|nr:SgcJ/EcaC family oxidoreductase [Polyangia bacterium]
MARETADETAIRKLVETWHRATADSDVATVLRLVAEDVVFLAPERPPMRGRASFAQGLTELLKTHTVRSIGEVRDVKVSGDLGYCWAELTVTATPLDGGAAKLRKGPALSIFRKESNGAWVLIRDANMLASDSAALELKVDNLERELMADGPGG